MRSLRTIFFFILMNVAVLVMISAIFTIFHLEPYITAQGLNLESLLIFSAIIGFTGSFISLFLSRWMAKKTFRITIIKSPHTSEETILFHMVESLASRAGISMPEVGIYPSTEINAFATGPTRNRALVSVSQGLLSTFTKQELEGVLSHEISHVASGDMMTMTLLQGVLNTFVIFISRVLAYVVESALGKDSEGINYIVYFVASIVFEIIFGILAGLILNAYSRHREFLADAGGASFAGKSKMVAALQRLKENTEKINTSKKQTSFATLKISDKPSFVKWWSTHPSLDSRIERLQKLSIS